MLKRIQRKAVDIEFDMTVRRYNAIPKGESFHKNHVICELYFKKQEVLKEFVHCMPNGEISIIPRDKPSLKNGSVPSVFPETIKKACEKESSN